MSETRTGNLIACARCGGTHELECMDDPADWRIILLQYRCGMRAIRKGYPDLSVFSAR